MKPSSIAGTVALLAALLCLRVLATQLPIPGPYTRVGFDLLGGLAAVWAASHFDREDGPNLGWWLVAGTHWFLGLGRVWAAFVAPPWTIPGARALIVLANVCWPMALFVFGHALDRGLAELSGRRGRALAWLFGLAALSLALWVIYIGVWTKLIADDITVDRVFIAGSDAFIMLADAAVFTAAARLLAIAAPILDGAVVRTYALLCLSAALSLGAEALVVLQPQLELTRLAGAQRWLGAGAWATLAGAAVLQAWILTAMRRARLQRERAATA